MKTRVTVSGIVRNQQGKVLICKMPQNRGAYPGQWAIPGGGIEEGEQIRETLARELREEVGLGVIKVKPFGFDDDVREKVNKDGSIEVLYMIHLVFEGEAESDQIKINDEFEAFAWVETKDLKQYDLNSATVKTFRKKGWIE
jgi:nucleoside triphosphatase